MKGKIQVIVSKEIQQKAWSKGATVMRQEVQYSHDQCPTEAVEQI